MAETLASDTATTERQRIALAAECARDPLLFVKVAFPWGEGSLAGHGGPMEWQSSLLANIRDRLLSPTEAIRLATCSGHGIGKSTVVAWIALWGLCTRTDSRVIITANTLGQLTGKTWPELVKWLRICLFRDWFEQTSTAIFSRDPRHQKTWRADAIAWSEERPESFAGLHNQGYRTVVIFDEASAIPAIIWEVVEGAMTDAATELVWAVFGNPTRPDGRFFECFNRYRHRWLTRQIDSRTVPITNKELFAAWEADYGEDSDFFRVRVRGVFPRAGSMQFISHELVEEARKREVLVQLQDPFVIGVDVARFGDDQTVIYCRKGRDARNFPLIRLRGVDTMAVAAQVFDLATRRHADAVFVDGGAAGGGVIDRLRQMGLPRLFEVQFGAKADRDVGLRCANKRAEIWTSMREWLKVGALPDDPELLADLSGPQFSFNVREELLLEAKPDMRRRGLASPDAGDALALTFAYPIGLSRFDGGYEHMSRPRVRSDYDVLEHFS